MKHISEEQLFALASMTNEMSPYGNEEIEQLNHIENCEVCYNKFCTALLLDEMDSPAGQIVLSGLFNHQNESHSIAVLKFVQEKVNHVVSAFAKQIDAIHASLQFTPALAASTRGGNSDKGSICKMENPIDPKTFVLYDSASHEVAIQIHGFEGNVEVYLSMDNGEHISVPTTHSNAIIVGVAKDIPDTKFELHIERK